MFVVNIIIGVQARGCGEENGLTENDGHENDGQKTTAGREVAGEQTEF